MKIETQLEIKEVTPNLIVGILKAKIDDTEIEKEITVVRNPEEGIEILVNTLKDERGDSFILDDYEEDVKKWYDCFSMKGFVPPNDPKVDLIVATSITLASEGISHIKRIEEEKQLYGE